MTLRELLDTLKCLGAKITLHDGDAITIEPPDVLTPAGPHHPTDGGGPVDESQRRVQLEAGGGPRVEASPQVPSLNHG